MSVTVILGDIANKMEGAISSMKHSLNGLRAGRASTSLLDPIKADAYGNITPINQLGTINTPDSRLITVQVWDKEMVKPIEKAIMNANLGLNPVAEGQVIRIALPNLSQQRRQELVKKAYEYCEQAKVSMRNIRRSAIDQIRKMAKNKEISEDEMHNNSDKIQKITDDFVNKTDSITENKSKEIMSI